MLSPENNIEPEIGPALPTLADSARAIAIYEHARISGEYDRAYLEDLRSQADNTGYLCLRGMRQSMKTDSEAITSVYDATPPQGIAQVNIEHMLARWLELIAELRAGAHRDTHDSGETCLIAPSDV